MVEKQILLSCEHLICDKMNKIFIPFLGKKAKTPPFRGFYHKKGGFLSKDVEDFTFPNIDIFGK